MDVIGIICDEHLAFTDILTEHRQHLLDVLRDIKAVTLDDLDNILQFKKKSYCGHGELGRS